MIPIFSVALIFLAALGLITASQWRTRLAWLVAQGLAAFLLISQYWPWNAAAAAPLTLWGAAVILGLTLSRRQILLEDSTLSGFQRAFGSLATLFISLFLLSISYLQPDFLPGGNPLTLAGGLIALGNALIRFGLRETLFDHVLSLLSLINGFMILYAAIETSLLVNLLLSALTLGIALVGSYFLTRATEERNA